MWAQWVCFNKQTNWYHQKLFFIKKSKCSIRALTCIKLTNLIYEREKLHQLTNHKWMEGPKTEVICLIYPILTGTFSKFRYIFAVLTTDPWYWKVLHHALYCHWSQWNRIINQFTKQLSYRITCCRYSFLAYKGRAPRKHFSWASHGHVAFEYGQALIFFRQARKCFFLQILISRFY